MNLENRFFYRLVKVLNYFSHCIYVLVSVFIIFDSFPRDDIPDDAKSYIVCDNGKKSRPVSNIHLEISSYYKDIASSSDANRVKKFCATDSNGNVTDQVMQEILSGRLSKDAELHKNYSLNIVYEPRDWSRYLIEIVWFLIAYPFFYIVTNLIRETLVYLAFGKKFDWVWAKIIINKFRVIYAYFIKL